MAEKRMFSISVIDSDPFLEMPVSAQNLYFHLSMRADDDGFVNKPKSIIKLTNSSEDDLKVLFVKKFVIPFESGVVVIKHWRINNYIRKDTYKPTNYREEFEQLDINDNGSYSLRDDSVTNPSLTCDEPVTQNRLDKNRLDKIRLDICLNRFNKFWNEYPKKQSKQSSYKAFQKIDPDDELLEVMISKLKEFKQLEQWNKNNGEFIPLPSTWLNQRRWEDELEIKGIEEQPGFYTNF